MHVNLLLGKPFNLSADGRRPLSSNVTGCFCGYQFATLSVKFRSICDGRLSVYGDIQKLSSERRENSPRGQSMLRSCTAECQLSVGASACWKQKSEGFRS
jgi:hypothetical protein